MLKFSKYKTLHSFYELVEEDPLCLGYCGTRNISTMSYSTNSLQDVEENVASSFNILELNPLNHEGYSGAKLFDYMTNFRIRFFDKSKINKSSENINTDANVMQLSIVNLVQRNLTTKHVI